MAAAGGIFAPVALGILRKLAGNASKVLRKKVSVVSKTISSHVGPSVQTTTAPLRLSPAHTGVRGQPIHHAALLRQQRRLFSRHAPASQQNLVTTVRSFISSLAGKRSVRPSAERSKLPFSAISRTVSQLPRTPFAHTLRPNLTGGAIPRSASGYCLTGGGVRYFSHSPTAPAQVMQNVSQAMRCFVLQGKRARFDGVDSQGRNKYRTVSALEDKTTHITTSVPSVALGSFVDFRLAPTITAMSPLAAAFPFAESKLNDKNSVTKDPELFSTINAHAAKVQQNLLIAHATPTSILADGFLDELSLDISRAINDLSATISDIQRLSALGDLPVELIQNDDTKRVMTLRVRFPGVDAATVEAMCDDIGIKRGLVGQDANFDVFAGVPVALKFPFAPGCDYDVAASCNNINDAADDLGIVTSPCRLSFRSLEDHELQEISNDAFSEAEEAFLLDEFSESPWVSDPEGNTNLSPSAGSYAAGSNFEGIDDIYRFIAECDYAKHQIRSLNI